MTGPAGPAPQDRTTGPALLGVRHHGPGSARAVLRALVAYRPEIVLIEGPPEADVLVDLVSDEGMAAPVALLAYPLPAPGLAAAQRLPAAQSPPTRLPASFWPFAEFSPEWQALRWAVGNRVPVRFIDLPAAVRLATDTVQRVPAADDAEGVPGPPGASEVRTDPIAALAAAAGYDDPERWWEDVVEHRREDPSDPDREDPSASAVPAPDREDRDDAVARALAPFVAIAAAMREVRDATAAPPEADRVEQEQREAHMRRALRAAAKEYERVAVVCGAWHVPALSAPLPPAAGDASILRGLPRTRVAMTWVPWTHARLASWQGYGAGVSSPGWYHHLFTAPDHLVARWMVKAAGVLRAEGVAVSSAHVIEGTRLANALATLRGRPLAGLSEVTDAVASALCDGDALRLSMVTSRLVVGERLGRVPASTPAVPIAQDVAAGMRRLRLPADPQIRDIDLDLRRDLDLGRSRLLHRLRLLGVTWGEPLPARRGLGTFWESWRLAWQPEFAVDLVEAGAYGVTVADAAAARAAELAGEAGGLAEVTALVERCLLADLAPALPTVLQALDDRVALDHDVAHLMEALPALARTLRYGDVRGTDTAALRIVATGMVIRICIGLCPALSGLNDAAAVAMRGRIDAVHTSVGLLCDDASSTRWYAALASLAPGGPRVPELIVGRLNRLLLDAGQLTVQEAGRRMALILTVGVPASAGAAWIEGFLGGDGLLLVHDQQLLRLVDQWLVGIPADAFNEVLPLLRRTFSGYTAVQRRMIGERAVRLGAAPDSRSVSAEADRVDPSRGAPVLATVSRLLGWPAGTVAE